MKYLLTLPRSVKKTILTLLDISLISVSFFLAFLIRLPDSPKWLELDYRVLLYVVICISVPIFYKLNFYKAITRYVGAKIVVTAFLGSLLSVIVMLGYAFYTHTAVPRSVPIIYFFFLFGSLVGSRLIVKFLLKDKKHYSQKIIIYGAGDSGRQLLESAKQVKEYRVVAFVDDNKALHGTVMQSLPVLAPSELSQAVDKYDVKLILLAIPSANQQQRKEIITRLGDLSCEVLVMPGLKDLVEGKVNVSALKKVSTIDLLGREAIAPNGSLMQKNIAHKVIMVTGAGGSIGSELCRQIVTQRPRVLILFELSEFFLYQIEQELSNYIAQNQLAIEIVPAMGSVQNQRRMTAVMKRFNVDTVYHAAAYKHVPLVEYNTIEGVRNNTFGTLRCAQAAIEAGVETFVLISTDKAVRPTNTMGATKRMAELVLQALAERRDHDTCFCMVRFGNVLGSSGSVIPLFERQIAEGGRVTLTHPEITRFFMTIPEAAQLVIQAGAMGKGGDVFLLDMGEPVKIIDLARHLINLSGLSVKDEKNPDGDIEIEITGLRPGEKLYEELLIGNQAEGTSHQRIMTSKEVMLPWGELEALLDSINNACEQFDTKLLRQLLIQAPTDFQPSSEENDILCVP